VRQASKKHRNLVRAAYAVFRELQGEYGKPLPTLQLPPPTCIICGITLTGLRTRMCGSRSCNAARERERRELIATGQYTFPGRWHRSSEKRRQNPKNRSQREYAAYLAMRELNLLPTESKL
jgi:hypothetical protein